MDPVFETFDWNVLPCWSEWWSRWRVRAGGCLPDGAGWSPKASGAEEVYIDIRAKQKPERTDEVLVRSRVENGATWASDKSGFDSSPKHGFYMALPGVGWILRQRCWWKWWNVMKHVETDEMLPLDSPSATLAVQVLQTCCQRTAELLSSCPGCGNAVWICSMI